MTNLNNNKKLRILLLLIVFIILISWTVKFKFLKLEDFKLLAILVTSTLILVLLGSNNMRDKRILINKIRMNLFLTGMLMSLMLIFDLVVSEKSYLESSMFFQCAKPMIFVLMIYLPIYNIFITEINDSQPISEEGDIKEVVLSRRENEVLGLILKGSTNKEISSELYIAENTVKKHVQNILKKTDCIDRVMLIKKIEQLNEKKQLT